MLKMAVCFPGSEMKTREAFSKLYFLLFLAVICSQFNILHGVKIQYFYKFIILYNWDCTDTFFCNSKMTVLLNLL